MKYNYNQTLHLSMEYDDFMDLWRSISTLPLIYSNILNRKTER
jgi:hypothetical protein